MSVGPLEDQGTLASLGVGERGVVQELRGDSLTRRRLLDLGLVPGTEVEAVLVSPWGDPVAYLVRGTLLALRREDARMVVLRQPGCGVLSDSATGVGSGWAEGEEASAGGGRFQVGEDGEINDGGLQRL